MAEVGSALVAWIGATLVLVADGRRGMAVGTVLATAGLASLAFSAAGPVAAGALAVGGVIAAARRFASGPPGWAILPPGSTPRLVLCIAAAIVAFWFAAGVTTGPGAAVRFAVLLVTGLAAARALVSLDQSVLLTASALLALAVGLGVTLAANPGPWPFLAAGAAAAAIPWLPPRTPSAA